VLLLAAVSGCGDERDGTAADTPTESTVTNGSTSNASDDASTDGTSEQHTSDDATASDGDEPGELAAFRIVSMFLRDPHLYVGSGRPPGVTVCADITDAVFGENFNDSLNESIAGDVENSDGYLDLNLVLVFRPFVQQEGGPRSVDFVSGRCTAPAATTTCELRPNSSPAETLYVVMNAGVCHEPDPSHLSVFDYDPRPSTTQAPCFRAGPADFTIAGDGSELVLQDVEIAGQFVENPAHELVSGTMRGFLSTAVAESTAWLHDRRLSELLPGSDEGCASHDDRDGDGWWIYLDFTAQRVPWNDP
jgi:hypothetical protein